MRADRLLSILMLLQARGRMTAQELAERLEVSERTIYRDLDALSASGVPVYTERGPGGGCTLLDGYQTTLTGLTAPEVRALFMSSVAAPLAQLGLHAALDSALLKLMAALPSGSRRAADQSRARFHVDMDGWQPPTLSPDKLTLLQEAIWQDRSVCLTNHEGTDQTVQPYGLVAKAGAWYLVAAVDETPQVLPIHTIQRVAVCNDCFERPSAFDLAAYWAAWCEQRAVMLHSKKAICSAPLQKKQSGSVQKKAIFSLAA